MHARVLKRMPLIQAFLVLGFWLLTGGTLPITQFLLWAALTLTVECLRAYAGAHALHKKQLNDARSEHTKFALLAALAGSAIAVGAVMFLPQLSVMQRAAIGFLLTAIPAAGVGVSQSSRYIIGSYALAILVPAAYIWGVIYPEQALGMMMLALLYSGVLVLVAADNEKLVLRSIIIRHERDRVVKDLEQRNADVREAMAKAKQSAQARARVLAAASHDLRQPLNALSVYSAVLAAHPTPATLREVGQNIDQIVRSLGSLLGGLLDLSRLSRGYYVPEKVHFALDGVLNRICDELKPLAEGKSLALGRDIAPITLHGDPVAAGRIARNLIDNAIKYTDTGEVRVTAHIENALAIMCVTDSGKGIPLSEHQRIFEEFYQLDNPGRDRSRGVGLGLAIVQRLCELLEAKISLESEPDHGACFTVAFPGVISAPAREQHLDTSAPSPHFAGKRVYVVDDEIDTRKSMHALLSMWGLNVTVAESATDAEALFACGGKPDVLIADLRLGPGEHGAALATRMQRAHGAHPVIIITGETVSESLLAANQSAFTVLTKPIEVEKLHHAIEVALNTAAAQAPSPTPLAMASYAIDFI